MSTITSVIGRVLIGAWFIVAGAMILIAPAPSDAAFTAVGLVPGTVWMVAAFELIGGICLVIGALTRLFALLLAAWMVISLAIFPPVPVTVAPVPGIMMNLVVIGALLLVFAHSQIWWSWDAMRRDRLAERDAMRIEREREAAVAQARIRNAELAAETRNADLRAERADANAALSGGAATLPRRRRWLWW